MILWPVFCTFRVFLITCNKYPRQRKQEVGILTPTAAWTMGFLEHPVQAGLGAEVILKSGCGDHVGL